MSKIETTLNLDEVTGNTAVPNPGQEASSDTLNGVNTLRRVLTLLVGPYFSSISSLITAIPITLTPYSHCASSYR
jgi:hypothetical protein